MTGIPIANLTPLKLPEGAIRKLTPEEQDKFKARLLEGLERRYQEPVDLQNHPSQQLYATVKDRAGNVIAIIYNGGATSSSNAVGAQLSGMPGTGAEARAEWIARKFGGRIELAPTAMSDAAFAQVPPVRFRLNREAMEADPLYRHAMGLADDRQTVAPSTREALLETQETTYDFTTMTRRDIAETGNQLFREGRITLDELFRFEHPDGKLKVDLDGNRVDLNPDDRIDFIAETRQAIRDLEETGHAWLPQSPYEMMKGLLAKLTAMQAAA